MHDCGPLPCTRSRLSASVHVRCINEMANNTPMCAMISDCWKFAYVGFVCLNYLCNDFSSPGRRMSCLSYFGAGNSLKPNETRPDYGFKLSMPSGLLVLSSFRTFDFRRRQTFALFHAFHVFIVRLYYIRTHSLPNVSEMTPRSRKVDFSA